MKQILVVMEGGVVQDIVGIPKGWEVVVWDYDVEGLDLKDYLDRGELYVQEKSGLCTQTVWTDANSPADLSDVRPATKEDIE